MLVGFRHVGVDVAVEAEVEAVEAKGRVAVAAEGADVAVDEDIAPVDVDVGTTGVTFKSMKLHGGSVSIWW